MASKKRIQEIQRSVLDWYVQHKRDLPWRRTTDPYAILVSEIMLQQTQVSRVIPKYIAFLAEFPSHQDLAAASPAAVIRAWKGLGYNRRALNLRKAVTVVMHEYAGRFPSSIDELRRLPGIGSYTAGAVATFAFGLITPAVDTNVRQFIDFFLPARRPRTEKQYEALATSLIPKDSPKEWLHAMMDYASLVIRTNPQRIRRNKKTAEPFIGSNRYLRGQTVDRLRERSYTREELYSRVAKPVEVSTEKFVVVLDGLVRDGMITYACSKYQLTGDD